MTINSDRRLWRRNFKFGMLPGDISVQAKTLAFSLRPDRFVEPYRSAYNRKVCKKYRAHHIRRANRRWRHEFKQTSFDSETE